MQMIMKDVKLMTDKAYIVVNEQQEREVLEKLEREGFTWWGGYNLTENTPSKLWYTKFPYTIFVGKNTVTWNLLSKLEDEEIVFDGRKEEHMSEKYVVSQEFIDALVEWKEEHDTEIEISLTKLIGPHEVNYLATIVDDWWLDSTISNAESNNRLIAIIRWVNGEDVFEVEKPKKWVVRSKETNSIGYYGYIEVEDFAVVLNRTDIDDATRFDTKEEAESWANSHQEVVEVGE